MWFQAKRYWVTLRSCAPWLYLSLIPVIVFLALKAITPSSYFISQEILVQQKAPLTTNKNPLEIFTIEEALARPDRVLVQEFALLDFKERLFADPAISIEPWVGLATSQLFNSLRVLVGKTMTLTSGEVGTVTVQYQGRNKKMGLWMVDFYVRRLLSMSDTGMRQAQMYDPESSVNEKLRRLSTSTRRTPRKTLKAASDAPVAVLKGGTQVTARMTVWEMDRLGPAVLIFILSLLAVLVGIGFKEYSDPTFKSERQAARYLELNILGSIPQLDPIAKTIQPNAGRDNQSD